MTYRYAIGAIGFLLLLLATSAHAGVATLTPHLSISEEYTDNRNLTSTDPQEERSTIVSPGFVYSNTEKRVGMDLSYTAGYVTYHETDADATWRHNANLSFWADFSKHTTWALGGGYVRTDENLNRDLSGLQDDTFPIEEDTTVRKGRNLYETGTASTSLTHQFGEQDAVTLRYLYSTRRELEVEDGNDNQRHAPAIALNYWFTPQFGFDLSATYTRGEFENSDNTDDWQGIFTLNRKLTRHLQMYLSYDHAIHRYETETGRDYDKYAPSAGISYRVEEDISLSLGAGYYYQDMKEGRDSSGPFVNGSINKSWSYARGGANLNGSAGLDRNDFGSENLGLQRFYGLSGTASYSLTRRLHASINASFRRNEYLNTPDGREDNRGQAGLGLTYSPLPWLSIKATYSQNRQRSTLNMLRFNLSENEYNENVALLTVSLFPRGHRYDY